MLPGMAAIRAVSTVGSAAAARQKVPVRIRRRPPKPIPVSERGNMDSSATLGMTVKAILIAGTGDPGTEQGNKFLPETVVQCGVDWWNRHQINRRVCGSTYVLHHPAMGFMPDVHCLAYPWRHAAVYCPAGGAKSKQAGFLYLRLYLGAGKRQYRFLTVTKRKMLPHLGEHPMGQ